MDITRADHGRAERGPEDWFAGEVEMEELAPAHESGGVQLMKVHFGAESRTAWHSHPAGQLLHVTAGFGLVQSVGGEAEGIGRGDTVWAGPGECHWHGATAQHALTHLAIQEPGTTWMEHVSDEDYAAAAAAAMGS
jgi:quercetin dioxygenase-like cupin family protein